MAIQPVNPGGARMGNIAQMQQGAYSRPQSVPGNRPAPEAQSTSRLQAEPQNQPPEQQQVEPTRESMESPASSGGLMGKGGIVDITA